MVGWLVSLPLKKKVVFVLLTGNKIVEIGANWIHGPCEENPVFRLARQYGLLEQKALSLENQTTDVNGHPVFYPNVFTSSGQWMLKIEDETKSVRY